jgi:hypothetical protein
MLRRSPRHLQPKNRTSSRVGDGRTGSTRERIMNKGNNSQRFRHRRILRGCRAEKGRDRAGYAPEIKAFGAPGSRGSGKRSRE